MCCLVRAIRYLRRVIIDEFEAMVEDDWQETPKFALVPLHPTCPLTCSH
jgi:hypothetical protein